jgi:hypothetical protein
MNEKKGNSIGFSTFDGYGVSGEIGYVLDDTRKKVIKVYCKICSKRSECIKVHSQPEPSKKSKVAEETEEQEQEQVMVPFDSESDLSLTDSDEEEPHPDIEIDYDSQDFFA